MNDTKIRVEKRGPDHPRANWPWQVTCQCRRSGATSFQRGDMARRYAFAHAHTCSGIWGGVQ